MALSSGGDLKIFLSSNAPGIALHRTTFIHNLNAWKEIHCQLQVADETFVNEILDPILGESRAKIFVRWGQADAFTNWELFYVRFYAAQPSPNYPAGMFRITLQASDALWGLTVEQKTLGHKGTVSSIVESIAAANSLKCIVQPTAGNYQLIQSYQDDHDFLVSRLLRVARSEDGQGNYGLYIRDGSLLFCTPAWKPLNLYLLSYAQSGSFKLFQMNRNPDTIAKGGAGTYAVVVDPMLGQISEVKPDLARATRLAKNQPAFSANDQQAIRLNRSWSPVNDEAGPRTQNMFEAARAGAYEIRFSMGGAPSGLGIGDLCQLQNASFSVWGGSYVVRRVEGFQKGNVYSAKIVISRGQYDSSGAVIVQGGEDPHQAPGIDVNYAELSATVERGPLEVSSTPGGVLVAVQP